MNPAESAAALRQLLPIRQRRLDRASTRVRECELALQMAKQALEDANKALEDYVNNLPKLINELYESAMNTEITKQHLNTLTRKEGLLRAKVEDFRASVDDAQQAVEARHKELQEAQAIQRRESVKLDTLKDLEQIELKKLQIEEQRQLGRQIDELASAQYVRRQRSS